MARNYDQSPENGVNRIVEGTTVKGEISSDSNIRIDGTFTGNVSTKARLVVGPTGKVDGEIVCQNAEVEGKIIGKIGVQQLLSLKSTAKIDGDIVTDKLSIEPGAIFSGSCQMGGGKIKDMNNNVQNAKQQVAGKQA